jgi:hypothetical protein
VTTLFDEKEKASYTLALDPLGLYWLYILEALDSQPMGDGGRL